MLQSQKTADLFQPGFEPLNRASRRQWGAVLRSESFVAATIIICSLLAGALYTLLMGEDANWDWQNYHEYNVWAVLNDRYHLDVIPGGLQAYFNPTVYFPVYYLRHFLPSPYGLMIIGAIHGLNLALICLFARIVLREAATAVAVGATALIAASGAMTLSEVGTSFSDILLALPVIGGFALILASDRAPTSSHFAAGLLIGAAVGLKLTNVVYAVGAVAAVFAMPRPLRLVGVFGVGGLIGAALTGGEWWLITWRDTGNPIFPLFNAVFQSDEAPAINLMDGQFMPHSLLDALAYPIYWLVGNHRGAEFPFRDARFLVVTILLLLSFLTRLVRGHSPSRARDIQLIVLFCVSYVVWLRVFSIQRYAVVLELLCGPLIVLLLVRLSESWASRSAALARPRMHAAMLMIAGCIAFWSQPTDWWRRSWSQTYHPKIADEISQPATYLLLTKPTSYIAPLLPDGSRFFQAAGIGVPIVPGGIFDRRIRAGIEEPLPGGVRELHIRGEPYDATLLQHYGLTIDRSRRCVEIEAARPGAMLETCLLVKAVTNE